MNTQKIITLTKREAQALILEIADRCEAAYAEIHIHQLL